MKKEEISKRVLKDGKPLDLDLFTWDESTRTFSSSVDGLVLYFKVYNGCTFKTGSDCTFNTGSDCTFNTGGDCTFNTGSECTFKTGSECTFNTYSNCTFNTYSNCVIVRRDIFEVIQTNKNKTIRLNPHRIKGYLVEIENKFYPNGDISLGEHIICDNILSKVISRKSNVLKVINHEDKEISFKIPY